MNRRSLFKIVASTALFALVLWLIGPARVLGSFSRADPGWLAAGFLSAATATLLSALRWHALAAWLGIRVARREMILAYWRGVMANTVLPGATLGGDTLRALQLQRIGHRMASAAASVLLDRFSGLWMLVVISLAMTSVALASHLLSPSLLPLPQSVALTATAGLSLLALLAPPLGWQLSATLREHVPARIASLLDTLHARPRPVQQYFAQIGWSGTVQVFSIAAFTCGGHAVGLDLPWWQFVMAAGPVFVLAALPIGVGGWGTREAAAVLVLGGFGASRDTAVACAILYGLFATLQGLLGALSFFLNKGESRD